VDASDDLNYAACAGLMNLIKVHSANSLIKNPEITSKEIKYNGAEFTPPAMETEQMQPSTKMQLPPWTTFFQTHPTHTHTPQDLGTDM
jgi:hypothetical protein